MPTKTTKPHAYDRTRQREDVLAHLDGGILSIDQAAVVLHRSTRQVRRLLAAYRARGRAGLVHGNRGRVPANRTDPDLRAQVIELASTTYAGVNRAHLAELLAEREGLLVPERTLRRLLAEAGLSPVREHRAPRHRSRRERAPREGQLLQTDGSRHRWFGPEQPFATIIGAIDDATSKVTGGTFREAEDAAGYFITLTQTSTLYGLPWTLYSDRHGIFWRDANRPPTLTEQLTGKRSLTQVGRALEVAGIGWMGARSPQAKGRVERLWGTFQDRLVTELRLETITTIADANAFLPGFLVRHNAAFAVPAADPEPAWRAWPAGLGAETAFAFWYPRTVSRDNTLSWGPHALAVPRRADGRTRAGHEVILQERLDGSLWLEVDGRCEPLRMAPASAPTLRARGISPRTRTRSVGEPVPRPLPELPLEGPPRPAVDHPWRRSFKRE